MPNNGTSRGGGSANILNPPIWLGYGNKATGVTPTVVQKTTGQLWPKPAKQ